MRKKVFIFSRDPGGTNAVFPLINKLENKYCVVVYAKDAAIQIYNREKIRIKQKIDKEDYAELKKIVCLEHPDLIITGTSSDDFCEKYLWKIGSELQIPTFAILDHWCSYGIRFSKYSVAETDKYEEEYSHEFMPDKILVMDEFAKEKSIAERIPEERIVVTGQPHFEWIINKYKENIENAKKREDNIIRILYVSDAIEMVYGGRKNAVTKLGYSEKTIFEELIKSVERIEGFFDKKIEIIIKLHPKEERNSYDDYIKKTHLRIYYEARDNIWEFLPEMDVVCGSISMMLVESYICGKNIISIQIGDKEAQKFILEELGKVDCVRTDIELDKKLKGYILQESRPEGICFKTNVCENILKLVEDTI